VQAALATLPGARHITVDFDKKRAVVTVEQNTYDDHKLIQALNDAGFGGTIEGTREVASGGDDGDQLESPSNGNVISPPEPGDLSVIDSEPTSYSSVGFRRHLQVSSHLDHDVVRPGDSFRLAIVFDIEKGWHIYGNPIGPGIGRETVLSVEGPDEFDFDSARYAPAHRLEQDFGKAGKTWVWAHTGKTIHYLSGVVRGGTKPGNYVLTVQAFAQVCTASACLPGTVTVRLPVIVAPRTSPTKSVNSDLFDGFAVAKTPRAEDAHARAEDADGA